jgi:hypothetical protein
MYEHKTRNEIYEIALSHFKEHGYVPPNTHIAKQIGKTRQCVDQHILVLEALGKVKKLRRGLIVPVE